jgi:hypothetical protein
MPTQAVPPAQRGMMKYSTILDRAECLVDYWPKGEDRDEWVAKCYLLNYGRPIKVDTVTRARRHAFRHIGQGMTAKISIPIRIIGNLKGE